jgi:hypothetical protein
VLQTRTFTRGSTRLFTIRCPLNALSAFESRKTPVQTRAAATVEAMSNLLPQVAIDSKITVWRYNFQSIAGGDTPNAIGPFQVLDFGGRFSQNVLNLPLIRHYQSSRENIVAAEAALNGTREDIVSATVTSLSAVHPEVG